MLLESRSWHGCDPAEPGNVDDRALPVAARALPSGSKSRGGSSIPVHEREREARKCDRLSGGRMEPTGWAARPAHTPGDDPGRRMESPRRPRVPGVEFAVPLDVRVGGRARARPQASGGCAAPSRGCARAFPGGCSTPCRTPAGSTRSRLSSTCCGADVEACTQPVLAPDTRFCWLSRCTVRLTNAFGIQVNHVMVFEARNGRIVRHEVVRR